MFWWFEHKLVWIHHTALGLATIEILETRETLMVRQDALTPLV